MVKDKLKPLLPLCLIAALLSGCGQDSPTRYTAQFLDLFDTVTSLVGYAQSEEEFTEISQAFYDELESYHRLYDIYNSYDGINNIKTINDQAGIAPVTVDEKIIDLLEMAVTLYDSTNGRVNIAMGSVLEVWHDYREFGAAHPERAALPSQDELRQAAAHMDIRQIQIDRQNSTVYLADPNLRLDVGAVAKGYAVEMCARKLEAEGVDYLLISVGGNIRAIGKRADGSAWRVGVQNPLREHSEEYLCELAIQDMAVVTSGSYQRYYTVDGTTYHHIIDPDTLMPMDRYLSVTALCPDSGLADALSTALFNMEPDEGRTLVDSLPGTEAMWVAADGAKSYSSGFEDFIVD